MKTKTQANFVSPPPNEGVEKFVLYSFLLLNLSSILKWMHCKRIKWTNSQTIKIINAEHYLCSYSYSYDFIVDFIPVQHWASQEMHLLPLGLLGRLPQCWMGEGGEAGWGGRYEGEAEAWCALFGCLIVTRLVSRNRERFKYRLHWDMVLQVVIFFKDCIFLHYLNYIK